VLEAKDGVEALEVSKQYEGTIHLLMTDIIMPKMRGTEVKGNSISKAAAKYRRNFPFRVHGRSDLTYSWCEADRDSGKALHRRLAPANR